MKQQKIKQLALLGLASGLLAATSAQAAEKTTLNEGLNRTANPRSQTVAGCSGKSGCAVADNFTPSSSCARPQGMQPGMYPGAPAESGASCARPQYNQEDTRGGDLIQAGCAPHQYSVSDRNEEYDAEKHGRPMVDQPQQQPQSSFRYIGDTSVPPRAARQPNNSRYLSDMSVPPSNNAMPTSTTYPTPSSTSNRPQGNPAPFSTGTTPPNAMQPNMSPSPYSPQPSSTRMNNTTRVYEEREMPPTPAKTESSARKNFW